MQASQSKVRLYPRSPAAILCVINRSGFYVWLKQPLSNRAIEDSRLRKRIKEFYIASDRTYGSPWIHRDLREAGESCSVHRVAKIMRQNNLRAQIG